MDQRQYAPEEITFANIWGVCDEDAYAKALRTLDEDARSGKPFFAHLMTVSNHRPFTYPAGKVAIPNDAKSRAGGVMYTDYALGRFLEEARKRPWFDRTVFVITADHCASSAGRTELPLEKYHIPGVIYAPGFIAPALETRTVSQIDLMPTLSPTFRIWATSRTTSSRSCRPSSGTNNTASGRLRRTRSYSNRSPRRTRHGSAAR